MVRNGLDVSILVIFGRMKNIFSNSKRGMLCPDGLKASLKKYRCSVDGAEEQGNYSK